MRPRTVSQMSYFGRLLIKATTDLSFSSGDASDNRVSEEIRPETLSQIGCVFLAFGTFILQKWTSELSFGPTTR